MLFVIDFGKAGAELDCFSFECCLLANPLRQISKRALRLLLLMALAIAVLAIAMMLGSVLRVFLDLLGCFLGILRGGLTHLCPCGLSGGENFFRNTLRSTMTNNLRLDGLTDF